jgi:hypothetical protein
MIKRGADHCWCRVELYALWRENLKQILIALGRLEIPTGSRPLRPEDVGHVVEGVENTVPATLTAEARTCEAEDMGRQIRNDSATGLDIRPGDTSVFASLLRNQGLHW